MVAEKVKQLNGTDMAAKVFLLSDGNVLKQYYGKDEKRSQTMLLTHWNKEVAALHRLKGFPHFPQLLHYDQKKMEIVMTYCGERITASMLPIDWIRQCDEIGHILTALLLYHNDVFCKNITVKDGVLHLVDFGLWAEVPHKNNSMIQAIRKELGV